MANNDLSKKWNGLVKEYLDLEKSYKEKYKDDHIITSSVSTVTTFGQDKSFEYKERIIIVFLGSTVFHLVISIISSKIDFFSINWFLFYLIISLVAPWVFIKFKEQKEEIRDNLINELKEKLRSLEKLFEEVGLEIINISEFNEAEYIVNRIDSLNTSEDIAINAIEGIINDRYSGNNLTQELYDNWLSKKIPMCPSCGNTHSGDRAKRCSRCKKITCRKCSFTGCTCGGMASDQEYIIQ